MRFLALETDYEKLKKQFIGEGEEELLSSIHHVFSFLIPMMWIFPLTVVLMVAAAVGVAQGVVNALVAALLLFAWLFVAFFLMLNAFIRWCYNFLIITTEKIVIVHQHFLFSQKIHPIHIEAITSIQSASQFLGIGHCGILHITLAESIGATNAQIDIPYLPKPDVIVGIIEHANTLKKQRAPADKGPEEQEQKVQNVQEAGSEEIQDAVQPPTA